MKIVYALPLEQVVRSRSILGLCPLPVHWNCLSVSNQGAFNVIWSISFNFTDSSFAVVIANM